MAEENETNMMTEDRISELPDAVIYHIFSFLPTIYLIQMSLLSKRWRWILASTPFIHWSGLRYDSNSVNKVKKRKFLNILSNNLRCRKLHMQVPDPSVRSFKFHTDYILRRKDTKRLDDWLSFAVQTKAIKELDLLFRGYCLPEFVLNASSLTLLKLRELKLKLEAPSVLTFPSLKVLSLKLVESDAKLLRNLISGCPIIEDLDLRCLSINLDFDVSKSLKNLTIKSNSDSMCFTKQWLEGLISGLPLLERFNCCLYSAQFFNISIRSQSLKSLSIRSDFPDPVFTEVSIRTPNLISFNLACFLKLVISIEAPNLLEANLIVDYNYSMKASYDLIHFLSNFNGLKKMKLSFGWIKDLSFLENIRNTYSPPLPSLKHLDATIYNALREGPSELHDFLLWCAPSVETFKIEVE